MAFASLRKEEIGVMPTRYEYDLDANKEWRWIAVAPNGATMAVSPIGYTSLQDCMHAVGLMQAAALSAASVGVPHGLLPGVPHGLPGGVPRSPVPPERSLSRLQRR
jgi:uncharacterized protein YegP (UPF0339 family)